MSTPLQRTAFFEAIQHHDPKSVAVVHSVSGHTFSYGRLLSDVATAKAKLLETTQKSHHELAGERIAFLIENSYEYVVSLLTIIACNAIAVPLPPSFPASELRYSVNQSQSMALLSTERYSSLAQEVLKEGLDTPAVGVAVDKIASEHATDVETSLDGDVNAEDGGMMLYTSGTTARPKGVVLPQTVLAAQAKSLIEAWEYTPNDRLLHVLPLHHIHGTVNALLAPLLAGSTIEFMYPFNPDHVWRRIAAPFLPNPSPHHSPITFFTVVPTIWSRLEQTFPSLPEEVQAAATEAVKRQNLRLNISGSAALPTPIKHKWTEISSGNILLERYGMTEVGMALSCGLADEDRIDGSVGWPLPSVQARLVDPDTGAVIAHGEEIDSNGKERQGEIQLRGPTIFKGYFNNAAATAKDFTSDGWFKTGDIAARRSVEGAGKGHSGPWATGPAYFIQGRQSADIIKTGGEKVSALEIERILLALPQVRECAVVGLPSDAWGQKAAAIVVLNEGVEKWSALDMRRALKGHLVAYKIPQDMKVVDHLPRNAMGKINKKDLVKIVFGDDQAIRRRSIEVTRERQELKKNEKK